MTYADITQSRIQFWEKCKLREEELRDIAKKIFDDYEESLELKYAHWSDRNGTKRPYVTVQLKNQNDLHQITPIAVLRLDKDFKLNFFIATVLDDSIDGENYQKLVPISLYKDAGGIQVDVGVDKKSISVSDPFSDGAFNDVSKAIQAVIVSDYNDPRL
ncbi:MAG: hypothetical protein G3W58_02055 [Pantoea ananatis]|nr:hypothetical protein [Pantoea ananatis]